jgi:uncharacterized protein (DUF1330 family)
MRGWRRQLAGLGAVFLAACASAPVPVAAPVAPAAKPCYLVVQGVVSDRVGFRNYVAALPPLYEKYGGFYVAVGPVGQVLEGTPDFQSLVISQWPSCDAVRAFWFDPDYRKLVEARQAWGRFDVVLIEGTGAQTVVAPMAQQPR